MMKRIVCSLFLMIMVGVMICGTAGFCVIAQEKITGATEETQPSAETAEPAAAATEDVAPSEPAVPAEAAEPAAESADTPTADEENWWIGLAIGPVPEPVLAQLSPQLVPENTGIFVSAIVPDSPADKAGIKAYDIIVKMNDKVIELAEDIVEIVRKSGGKTIAVEVVRAGELLKQNVTPEKAPEERSRQKSMQDNWSDEQNFQEDLESDEGFSFRRKGDRKSRKGFPDSIREMIEGMEKQLEESLNAIPDDEELQEELESNETESDEVTRPLPPPQEESPTGSAFQGNMTMQRSIQTTVDGKKLLVTVKQQNNQPAEIKVEWDGKTYETTSDKLDVIPPEIRDKVRQFSESGFFRSRPHTDKPSPAPEGKNPPKGSIELDQNKIRNLY